MKASLLLVKAVKGTIDSLCLDHCTKTFSSISLHILSSITVALY